MPKRRSALAVVAVAAAIAAGGAIGLAVARTSGTDPSSTSSVRPQQAGAPSAPLGSPSGRTEPRAGTTESPSGSAAPTQSTPGSGGVEVQAEVPGSTPSTLPGLTVPSAASSSDREDLNDLADRSDAARGRLVEGYPRRLLPLAPRATVITSSVAATSDRVQVGLVAHRARSPEAVVRFYRHTLVRAGFEEQPAPAVGGGTAAAFVQDDDRVVVTVDPGAAGTYSVYAVLTIGKA